LETLQCKASTCYIAPFLSSRTSKTTLQYIILLQPLIGKQHPAMEPHIGSFINNLSLAAMTVFVAFGISDIHRKSIAALKGKERQL
jgi:hypothetical protein